MKCDFCGEPLDGGRHPVTESGARDVTRCQVTYLLRRNGELQSKLDAAEERLQRIYEERDHYRDLAASHSSRLGKCEKLLARLIEWDDNLQDWQRNPASVVGRIIAEARELRAADPTPARLVPMRCPYCPAEFHDRECFSDHVGTHSASAVETQGKDGRRVLREGRMLANVKTNSASERRPIKPPPAPRSKRIMDDCHDHEMPADENGECIVCRESRNRLEADALKPHPATRIFEQPYTEARCHRCGKPVWFGHECE